jgi:hypothetical protein
MTRSAAASQNSSTRSPDPLAGPGRPPCQASFPPLRSPPPIVAGPQRSVVHGRRTECEVLDLARSPHGRGLARSASRRARRNVMPSLVKTLFMCHSTVRGLRAPISGFVRPSRARRAMCSSCGVSSSRVTSLRLRSGAQLVPGALGECTGAHGQQLLAGDAQLLARVDPPALAAQRFAVKHMRASVPRARACARGGRSTRGAARRRRFPRGPARAREPSFQAPSRWAWAPWARPSSRPRPAAAPRPPWRRRAFEAATPHDWWDWYAAYWKPQPVGKGAHQGFHGRDARARRAAL